MADQNVLLSLPLSVRPANQNQLERFVTANRLTICSSRKHVAHEAVCSRLMPFPPFCLSPGDKLCSVEDCIPGTGVYLRHGYIYSSLAGYVLKKNEGEELPVISVVRETEAQLLPDVGAIVTCKVTSYQPQVRQGSHPLCWLHATEGSLQRDYQKRRCARNRERQGGDVQKFQTRRHRLGESDLSR
ncbi:Exosome complex component CSL4 [Larimichthys crocea]|uniref:Uncharacterized protein n=1 Tax=Larimichthys crocea TaxID=215358 RepID=A0ACD3RVS8_LARCR|nr:Exosome complex component CSL4 [Larimichthys crocea]